MDALEPTSLPEAIVSRRETIKRIEDSGVGVGDALKALVEEAGYVLKMRNDDTGSSLNDVAEDAEIAVIDQLVEFGFDPHDKKGLQTSYKAVMDLRKELRKSE